MHPLWSQSVIVFGVVAKPSHGLHMKAEHLLELRVLFEPQMMTGIGQLEVYVSKDCITVNMLQLLRMYLFS